MLYEVITLFWPGVVGQFMKYLPITVLICLSASLLMALGFIPVLGAVIGRTRRGAPAPAPWQPSIFTRGYRLALAQLLKHPALTLGAAVLLLVASYGAYGWFGKGVTFFPEVEPESAQVLIHARGDLSILEKDALVRQVEARLLGLPELKVLV